MDELQGPQLAVCSHTGLELLETGIEYSEVEVILVLGYIQNI